MILTSATISRIFKTWSWLISESQIWSSVGACNSNIKFKSNTTSRTSIVASKLISPNSPIPKNPSSHIQSEFPQSFSASTQYS